MESSEELLLVYQSRFNNLENRLESHKSDLAEKEALNTTLNEKIVELRREIEEKDAEIVNVTLSNSHSR